MAEQQVKVVPLKRCPTKSLDLLLFLGDVLFVCGAKVSASARSTVVVTRGIDRGSGLQTVNEVHQWGHGSPVPSRVSFNSAKDASPSSRWQTHDARVDIVDVAAARCHNVALDRAGIVFTWGFGADHLGTKLSRRKELSYVPQAP